MTEVESEEEDALTPQEREKVEAENKGNFHAETIGALVDGTYSMSPSEFFAIQSETFRISPISEATSFKMQVCNYFGVDDAKKYDFYDENGGRIDIPPSGTIIMNDLLNEQQAKEVKP